MGRFSGGNASRWNSWSEIKVRPLAPAIAVITNSPWRQDRDNFGTIFLCDIMRIEMQRQICILFNCPPQEGHRKSSAGKGDPSPRSDDLLASSRFSLTTATNGNRFTLEHFPSSRGVIAVET